MSRFGTRLRIAVPARMSGEAKRRSSAAPDHHRFNPHRESRRAEHTRDSALKAPSAALNIAVPNAHAGKAMKDENINSESIPPTVAPSTSTHVPSHILLNGGGVR